MPKRGFIIFCDGACSGNPGPGGWGAIVVSPNEEVRERGGGSPQTTNNQMELTAAIESLNSISGEAGIVDIYTDSTYVIRGITQWIWGWKRNGWKSSQGKDVANRVYWEKLFAVVFARGKAEGIQWHYVKGHSQVGGNERADRIAVAYSQGLRPTLYSGPLDRYAVDITNIPDEPSLPARRVTKAKSAPYSYLSLLGPLATRHATWADCERRIRGQSGAKFKKTMSKEDELSVLKSWGVDPKTVK